MTKKQHLYTPSVVFHPGETLGEKLHEMEMSIKELAVRTAEPEQTIIAVLSGKVSITSDMAIAFEHVTGIPADFWMSKQRLYDEYVARQKHAMPTSRHQTELFLLSTQNTHQRRHSLS
jgi:addiction module HigA family antidote